MPPCQRQLATAPRRCAGRAARQGGQRRPLARPRRLSRERPFPAAEDRGTGRGCCRATIRPARRSSRSRRCNGDTVYYEIGDTKPTTGSLKVSDAEGGYNNFRTRELKLSFLCVDSTGKHETGESIAWKNTLAIKHRVFQQGDDWRVELHAVPRGHIRYTTNGADPLTSGGEYDTPFTLPKDCRFVLAVAEEGDLRSTVEKIDVQEHRTRTVTVDAAKPATWSRPHHNLTAAKAFEFIDLLEKHQGLAHAVMVDVTGNETDVSLSFIAGENETVSGPRLRETVAKMQEIVGGSQVNISATRIPLRPWPATS